MLFKSSRVLQLIGCFFHSVVQEEDFKMHLINTSFYFKGYFKSLLSAEQRGKKHLQGRGMQGVCSAALHCCRSSPLSSDRGWTTWLLPAPSPTFCPWPLALPSLVLASDLSSSAGGHSSTAAAPPALRENWLHSRSFPLG